MKEKMSKKEEDMKKKMNADALHKSKMISSMGQKKYTEMMARKKY